MRGRKKVWGCDYLQVWLGLGGRELRWVAARDLDSASRKLVCSLAVSRGDQGTVRDSFWGGAESMPGWRYGQSAACELLPEVGRVNRGAKTMVA